jgi:hypothetical protein
MSRDLPSVSSELVEPPPELLVGRQTVVLESLVILRCKFKASLESRGKVSDDRRDEPGDAANKNGLNRVSHRFLSFCIVDFPRSPG